MLTIMTAYVLMQLKKTKVSLSCKQQLKMYNVEKISSQGK